MITNPPEIRAQVIEERIVIAGHGRRLEGLIAYPDQSRPVVSVLIAGPHPLLGGDIQNNVIGALVKGIAARGGLALTFNYSGVGDSEGGPDDWATTTATFFEQGRSATERDWVVDAASALGVLNQIHGGPRALVGYSFGCWAIAENLAGADQDALVLISPNPIMHPFDRIRQTAVPMLVIHSHNDFACDADTVQKWTSGFGSRVSFVLVHAGEHFFRGQEHEVVRYTTDYLWEQLP